jgi:hypothetical protein
LLRALSTVEKLWIAVPDDGDPVNHEIPDFDVRFIGPDSNVVTSPPFVVTNDTPSPGSETLSAGYKYIYATASIPKLAPATAYTLQVVDSSKECLPPIILGTFSS